MEFTDKDKEYMQLALEEADLSYKRGNFPVGALLSIDDKLIGKGGNIANTVEDWFSHAESSVIKTYSHTIKKSAPHSGNVKLYTTLEPCLMCLGTSVLNRINLIMYACQDPNGGATSLDKLSLPEWYVKKWPVIVKGPFEEDSYNLLVMYMRENMEIWGRILKMFEQMNNK